MIFIYVRLNFVLIKRLVPDRFVHFLPPPRNYVHKFKLHNRKTNRKGEIFYFTYIAIEYILSRERKLEKKTQSYKHGNIIIGATDVYVFINQFYGK